MRSSITGERLVTGVLGLLGVIVAVGGLRLKVGYLYAPEPGFFPFLAGAGIALFSCAQLLLGRPKEGPESGHPGRPLGLALALLIYSFLLESLGFVVATAILSAVVMRITRPQSWPLILVVSVSLAVVSYGVFSILLKVDLPYGSLLRG